jgi:uncharacterized protein (TIGR02271 family)
MPTQSDDLPRLRDGTDDDRIALIEERAVIGKRALDRGGVRVATRTETFQETLRVPLEDVSVEVERVPVGRYVEAAEDPREEGDVTVLPVYEERLVVEKKLFLVEEVRVRRVRRVRDEEIPVELRRQVAEVERLPADPAADPLPAGSPGGTAHPE